MVGITLSPEQIQEAPPEVRHWLQQQVASVFGPHAVEPALEPPKCHLVACDIQELRTVLSLIYGLFPVVGVFFELGREPVAASAQGLRALRLDQMLQHARLQSPEQLIACLQAIDEAVQRMRGEPDATLTALDGTGHCLVADATARNILLLWQEIVASRGLSVPDAAQGPAGMPAGARPVSAPHTFSVPAFVEAQTGGGGTPLA